MAVELAQPVVGGDGPGERFARFEALYRRYHPALVSACARHTNDHAAAEDIAHETFLRAYQHIDWLDVQHAWPWLKTVASRLAIDDARKLGRIRRLEAEDEPLVQAPSAVETPDPTEERILLSQALARLPTRQRTAVALRYIADYDLDEAAAALDIDHAAFKQLLFRARRRLRDEYRQISAGVSGVILWPLAFIRRARRLAWRAKHGLAGSRLGTLVQAALEVGAVLVVVGAFALNTPTGPSAGSGGGSSVGGTSAVSARVTHGRGRSAAFERGRAMDTGWVTRRPWASVPAGGGGTTCTDPAGNEQPEQAITTSVTDAVGQYTGGSVDASTAPSLTCGSGEGSATSSTSGPVPAVPPAAGSVQGAVSEVKAAVTAVSGGAASTTKTALGGTPGGAAAQKATDLATSATAQLTDQASSIVSTGDTTNAGSN
jgi:RNA polymerase sigma-70 factor, ECF subfamily